MKEFMRDISRHDGCYNSQTGYNNAPVGNDWPSYAKHQPNSSQFLLKFIGYTQGIIPEVNYDDKFSFLVKQMPQSGFPYTISLIHQKDLFPGSYRQGDTTPITRAYPEFNGYNLVFHIIHTEVLKYDFYLFDSYPNPFNATAKIEFGLPAAA